MMKTKLGRIAPRFYFFPASCAATAFFNMVNSSQPKVQMVSNAERRSFALARFPVVR